MSALVWLTENYPPQRGGMAQSCDRIVRSLRETGLVIHVIHFTQRTDGYRTETKQNGSYTAIPFDEDEAYILHRTWIILQQFKNVSQIICFGGHLATLGAPVFSRWFSWPLFTLIRGNDFDSSLFSPRKKKMLEDLLRQSSHVAAVTRDKVQRIERLFNIQNCHYIPNGIDLAHWEPSPAEVAFAEEWREKIVGKNRKCIGLIGQLKAKKGGMFFFSALTSLSLKDHFHFLLIGEIQEELQELLDHNQISYTHLPFMDRFELIRYYLCCDVVALPSFYDGMPNVLLEAGSLGVPVVGSSTDGMKDLILDEVNGWLFENAQEDSLRETLYRIWGTDSNTMRQIGITLKNTVYEKYTHYHEAVAYKRLFDGDFSTFHPVMRQSEAG